MILIIGTVLQKPGNVDKRMSYFHSRPGHSMKITRATNFPLMIYIIIPKNQLSQPREHGLHQ